MDNTIQKTNILDEMILNDYLYENTIYLCTEIDRNSQIRFCRELEKLALQELSKSEKDRKPIKINISSFGGWACSVFAMVSFMEYWQEQGIIISTYCNGYCASGGSKILMAGSKGYRYITRYATVLLHQPNGFKYGNSTLQEDIQNVEDSLKDWETLKDIFRKHTKLTEKELDDFTEKNINFIYRPQECLDKSIVDHII